MRDIWTRLRIPAQRNVNREAEIDTGSVRTTANQRSRDHVARCFAIQIQRACKYDGRGNQSYRSRRYHSRAASKIEYMTQLTGEHSERVLQPVGDGEN